MAEIEYFYAAHSAYAYFGSAKFMEIAKAAGRVIRHKPVDLDQVLKGVGSQAFRERSLHVRNYFFKREMERWCEFRGIPHLGRRPSLHHHSPDLANKVLIAGLDAGLVVDDLAHRFLEGHWAEDADLADEPTLVGLCEQVGFDGKALLDAAKQQAVADTYSSFTQEAVERGVFGSPTYFVDGDMFYGQDRLDLVERALVKPFADMWPAIQA